MRRQRPPAASRRAGPELRAGTQPVEVGAGGHPGEGSGVELVGRRVGEGRGGPPGPGDAAGLLDDAVQTQHLARQPALARPCQKADDPAAVDGADALQRMRQDERALALPQVAVDLLAVALDAAAQVEHVVGDPVGQPEQVAVAVEAAEIGVAAVGDQRADTQRMMKLYQAVFLSTSRR